MLLLFYLELNYSLISLNLLKNRTCCYVLYILWNGHLKLHVSYQFEIFCFNNVQRSTHHALRTFTAPCLQHLCFYILRYLHAYQRLCCNQGSLLLSYALARIVLFKWVLKLLVYFVNIILAAALRLCINNCLTLFFLEMTYWKWCGNYTIVFCWQIINYSMQNQ